jgi:hypothetical protein
MLNKLFSIAVGLILLGVAYPLLTHAQSDEAEGVPILAFKTMVPVTGPYVGMSNPIRTVPGGGLAWKIENGSGELMVSGRLRVRTRGLVLVNTGTNPVPMFRAIVSCQSIDSKGEADVVNISTDAFQADADGNSQADTKVELPNPCVAPIVFVTSPGGAWFAATGS